MQSFLIYVQNYCFYSTYCNIIRAATFCYVNVLINFFCSVHHVDLLLWETWQDENVWGWLCFCSVNQSILLYLSDSNSSPYRVRKYVRNLKAFSLCILCRDLAFLTLGVMSGGMLSIYLSIKVLDGFQIKSHKVLTWEVRVRIHWTPVCYKTT